MLTENLKQSSAVLKMASGLSRIMPASMQAVLDADDAPKAKQHLMTLPQEIQDVIFDFAYPVKEDFQFVTRPEWDMREMWIKKAGTDWKTSRFPEPKAFEFIVSKAFFVTAARAYTGNQIFSELDGLYRTRSVIPLLSRESQGFAHDFITNLTIDNRSIISICWPANLKSLTVGFIMRLYSFSVVVWENDLDDDECFALMIEHKLDELSGLREFNAIPSFGEYARKSSKTKACVANVARFGAFVSQYVTRPKKASDASQRKLERTESTPLYRRSKVKSSTSSERSPKLMRSDIYTTSGSKKRKRSSEEIRL